MPVFNLVVVGSGGGPNETNLSGYLLKPSDASWEDGIIALEGGSGQGALAQLLQQSSDIFGQNADDRVYSAAEIYSFVKAYYITHAHLDHINSLVISAGSLKGPRKRVYAFEQVLKDLEIVFSDRIWPNLASYDEQDEDFKLLYSPISRESYASTVLNGVSVRAMPLSHGTQLGNCKCYESTAFFIRHDATSREFLYFGDVEPDSVSKRPRTIDVWRAAASKIPEMLATIFIECSWPSGRKDDMLYGHLNPDHLVGELCTLAREVLKFRREESSAPTRSRPLRKRQRTEDTSAEGLEGALIGVRVFITHCKEVDNVNSGRSIQHIIFEQVRDLVLERGLGAEVVLTQPGMIIDI